MKIFDWIFKIKKLKQKRNEENLMSPSHKELQIHQDEMENDAGLGVERKLTTTSKEGDLQTNRKPPGMPWAHFIEGQIDKAQEEGAFNNLPGSGKPIPDINEPHNEFWWVKKLIKRENLSVLPDTMEIRLVVEKGLEKIWNLPSEKKVRQAVEDLNTKIRKVNTTTISGPPTSVSLINPDEVVDRWRKKKSNKENSRNDGKENASKGGRD